MLHDDAHHLIMTALEGLVPGFSAAQKRPHGFPRGFPDSGFGGASPLQGAADRSRREIANGLDLVPVQWAGRRSRYIRQDPFSIRSDDS